MLLLTGILDRRKRCFLIRNVTKPGATNVRNNTQLKKRKRKRKRNRNRFDVFFSTRKRIRFAVSLKEPQ